MALYYRVQYVTWYKITGTAKYYYRVAF